MSGDGSTGAWGSWEVKQNIFVTADSTGGAGSMVSDVVQILTQAGKNATGKGVGPDTENTASNNARDTTFFFIVNGVCPDTISAYVKETDGNGWTGPHGNATNCNMVVGFWTSGGGVCTKANIEKTPIFHAHDSGWASASHKAYTESFSSVADMLTKIPNGGGVAGPDANSLAQGLLSGKGSGGASGVNVVEGHIYSHEGTTPQFWNTQTYTPYERIRFTNFTMQDKYPHIRTATFETPENIDLTEGRVAVLITGDCNDFGGIIIKKTFDAKTRLYKYHCQGFMERIMASPVYVVANGGHTAHHLISEYLAEIGLPSVNLKEPDEYDVFIDEFTQEMLKANKDEYDSVDMFNARDDLKIDVDKVTGVYGKTSNETDEESTSSDEGSDESGVQQQETAGLIINEEKSHDDDYEIINTFKAKPAGIYDKLTGGDFIRTLIFDYGINVDFYGDVNGIPHFDIMDMEKWKTTGWHISADMGYGTDYESEFDITDIVTQVGVKNIQAINGNGELYTSEELLGVNLERYVGRMGTIVDNPNEKQAGGAQTDQIQQKYVDEEGNEYTADQVLSTNGEPSCSNCTKANGGSKPEMKKYQMYWVNKCPGCDKEGTLESKTEGHGKTVCKECKEEFCQFCGTGTTNTGNKLTKVTLVSAVSGATTDTSSTSASTVSSSSSDSYLSTAAKAKNVSSSTSSSYKKSVTPGKSASRRASDYKSKKESDMIARTKKIMRW